MRSATRSSLNARLGRRRLLRSAGLASAGLAGAALLGCGGGGDATPAAVSGGGAPTAPTAAPTATPGPRRGGVYAFATTVDPEALDPYKIANVNARRFASFVYGRLFRIDAQPDRNPFDQLPVPDLAQSAESPDGQNWVVKLRPGVKFQNVAPVGGRTLSTDDVLFSWQRLSAPEGLNASQVAHVSSVQAIDAGTLQFRLKAASPTFLEMLASDSLLWIQPKEAASGLDLLTKPIGTGPWILDQYRVASGLHFKRNPDFYEAGLPYLDGIDQLIIPEYANQLVQFETGKLHSLGIASGDVLDLKKRRPEFQWKGDLSAVLWFVFFSPEEKDPRAAWRDERFRQAISMSIDRESMSDLLYNVQAFKKAGLDVSTAWNNIVPAGFGNRWWLDPKSAEQGPSAAFFRHNPADARKLLAAVGESGKPFKYQWTNNRYGPTFAQAAEAIHGWMTAVGLAPQTETQDSNSVYLTQTFRGNFNGVAFGIESPFPEVGGHVDRMFAPGPANHGRIADPKILDLLGRQARELDVDRRSALIKDIQREHDAKMYYVPTQGGAGVSFSAHHPKLRGIRSTRGSATGNELLARYWLDA
ncbi:MAG: ABC transporter substrate-binding protein [Chloroflexi bacterium]|nr:ABC transporter substrate-binding protein [Chloroflexota bacterium]